MRYLKFWRFVKGKSQVKIAKEIGISQGHYCDIERGAFKPNPELYGKIADAIGRPVEEVVGKLHGVDPREMRIQGTDARA